MALYSVSILWSNILVQDDKNISLVTVKCCNSCKGFSYRVFIKWLLNRTITKLDLDSLKVTVISTCLEKWSDF